MAMSVRGRAGIAASNCSAASFASPTTATSAWNQRPMLVRTLSIWISGKPAGIDAPKLVVFWLRPAPMATTQSACSIRRRPPALENEPNMPQSNGWPRNMSLAFIVVASAAPTWSARRMTASRAPARWAPRPTRKSGLRLFSSKETAAWIAPSRAGWGVWLAGVMRAGAVAAGSICACWTLAGSSKATAPCCAAAAACTSVRRAVTESFAVNVLMPAPCSTADELKPLRSGPRPFGAGCAFGASLKIINTGEPLRCVYVAPFMPLAVAGPRPMMTMPRRPVAAA